MIILLRLMFLPFHNLLFKFLFAINILGYICFICDKIQISYVIVDSDKANYLRDIQLKLFYN